VIRKFFFVRHMHLIELDLQFNVQYVYVLVHMYLDFTSKDMWVAMQWPI
jgi:hypothetical protein